MPMSLPIFLGTADGVDSSAQHDQHEKNLSDPCRVAKLTAFFTWLGNSNNENIWASKDMAKSWNYMWVIFQPF